MNRWTQLTLTRRDPIRSIELTQTDQVPLTQLHAVNLRFESMTPH